MKKSLKKIVGFTIVLSIAVLSSCGKNKCETCDYYKNNEDIELGEYCGDDLKDIEKNGYTDSTGTTYDVHCGGH